MENLATANLVDVTLHSRVPVSRLVDWVDQAHLYLHLEPRKSDSPSRSRTTLRRLGIRTATGLEDALRPAQGGEATANGLVSAEANAQLVQDLQRVLNPEGLAPSVTMSLLKTFENDPNLKHVRHWRRDWRKRPAADQPVRQLVGAGANGHGTGAY